MLPRLYFCLHVEHAFKTSSIKISTSDTCLMINSCSIFGLTSKLLHYSGKQSSYIDTATFLNFMSCRCSNKNICMHIKASASSKISPLHCIYFSSHWSRLLYSWTSIGLDSRCRSAHLWRAGQRYGKFFLSLHEASTQAPTSKPSPMNAHSLSQFW